MTKKREKSRELPASQSAIQEEAERAVLGGIILCNDSYSQCRDVLQPEDFCLDSHRKIFRAICNLADNRKPIDFVTLAHTLGQRETENVGGHAYIDSLTDGLPRVKNIRQYVEIVKDNATRRRLVHQINAISELAGSGAPVETLGERMNDAVRFLKNRPVSITTARDQLPLNTILDQLVEFIRRFVSLPTPSCAEIIALWVVHTYVFESFDVTPYLSITSAEKRSGKTRLLEVLELLVHKPWHTGRVTAAVLFRKIESDVPTLLLDESDTIFLSGGPYSEAVRGILNAGNRRGGKTSCCVDKKEISTKDFSCFCPKAIAGIGNLPDTVSDRSLLIRLRRRSVFEKIERFRRRRAEEKANFLRLHLRAWSSDGALTLRGAEPRIPEFLNDRQEEAAEPLLAIAELAENGWADRARHALMDLCRFSTVQDQSAGVHLLADIKYVFDETNLEKMPSASLVEALRVIESTTLQQWHSGSFSPVSLSRMLKPYGIAPRNLRDADHVIKGYIKSDFEDPWTRYLPSNSSSTPQPLADEPLHPLQPSNERFRDREPQTLQDGPSIESQPVRKPITTRTVALVAARHGRTS